MKIVIVGAGPTGCTIAPMLAKKGHDIKLVEKMNEKRDCKSKSINITISERGLQALRIVTPDIEQTLLVEGMKAIGRIVHDPNGKQSSPTMYGQHGQGIISFQRDQLNDFLLTEAKNNKGIEVIFGYELVCLDPSRAQCTFHKKNSDEFLKMDGDLIIGCDGAHSVVRNSIQRRSALCYFEQKKHKHNYIEFYIPPNDKMDPNFLHMWPRGEFMMLALPNKDKSFCGNLFMPWDDFGRVMTSSESLLAFCRYNFKDLLDIIGESTFVEDVQPHEDFRANCLTSIKCEPYHSTDKVVLIGDAAHAVVPFYGQGMNAGFQDCLVLDAILDKYQHKKENLGKALQEFSDVQCPNGHAIADLAFEHYTQLRKGIAGNAYYVRQYVDRFLHSVVPKKWPIEYDMVAFSQEPYSRCVEEKQRQKKLLQRLLYAGTAVAFSAVVVVAFWYTQSLA